MCAVRRILFAINVGDGSKTGGSTHPLSVGTAHLLRPECAAYTVYAKDARTKDSRIEPKCQEGEISSEQTAVEHFEDSFEGRVWVLLGFVIFIY